MKKNVLYFIFFASCGNNLYTPVNEVMESTSFKGELNASFNFINNKEPLIQTTIAYSPLNFIGLSASKVQGFDSYAQSIGFGLYKRFDKKAINPSKKYLDLYFGIGNGRGIIKEDRNFGHVRLDYNKYFSQLGYHYSYKEKQSFDFSLRYCIIDITELEIYRNSAPLEIFLLYNDYSHLLEPSAKLSFGSNKYKLYLGANFKFFLRRYDIGNDKILSQYPLYYSGHIYDYQFDNFNYFTALKINLNKSHGKKRPKD